MRRLSLALVALSGLLTGGLGVSLLNRSAPDPAAVSAIVNDVLSKRAETQAPAPALDTAAVQNIVSAMLDARLPATPVKTASAGIDQATLNPMIETYLMGDPEILHRMSQALDTKTRTAEAEASRTAIASMQDKIFNDPNQVVLGNPDGDVTLVEMFDYNCGYCRSALPDLATLLAEDSKLRVVLKEFPILSEGSVEAAKVGVLVSKANVDYWSFHEALFTSRTPNNLDTALAAAKDLGLSPVDLQIGLTSDTVTTAIQTSYDIAKALNITGTPTYIIGDEIIPGAVGVDELRSRIANMRACGKTQCAG